MSKKQVLMFIPFFSFYYLFNEKIFSINKTDGTSMIPTIQNQEIVFIDKIFYKFTGLKKKDIIISIHPLDQTKTICKRVIALEGETIKGKIIPKNHIWIQGDNKRNSLDSRYFGPIHKKLVRGRVIYYL